MFTLCDVRDHITSLSYSVKNSGIISKLKVDKRAVCTAHYAYNTASQQQQANQIHPHTIFYPFVYFFADKGAQKCGCYKYQKDLR